ncbi:MAG TPA: hypothetical protein VM076_05085 [Gemmatimonadaceae bacterium]|nr:hypothetical protein [Gemmatimonadaceae bacterium]
MFLTSTAATIAAFALSSRLSMCDQTYYREVRPNDETLLVIRALDESVRTSDAAAPFAYPEWQPGSSRQPMAGQVVTVVEVIAQAVGVRQAMAAGSRVVLVPWAHDSGCEPIAWMSAPRWIPPGTEGFVAARLRARDKWAGRLPTFDVRDAWREPYTLAGR